MEAQPRLIREAIQAALALQQRPHEPMLCILYRDASVKIVADKSATSHEKSQSTKNC